MTSTLILGGTGKTGRRLAQLLRHAGMDTRTAARSGGDVHFDWADSTGHGEALIGVDRLYLVPPALSLDFAEEVIAFLDRAESAGVRHVSYLSARGVEFAPPQVAMRAVELDLIARPGLTHTILRPAFFQQNFTEGAFAGALTSGVLTGPVGDGAEAFIDVHDIAAVAAASLLDPAGHAGAQYELTGPQALTYSDVAALLTAHGHPVRYQPITLTQWLTEVTSAGLPDDYAQFLGGLLTHIASGSGSRPGPAVEQATGRPPRSLAEMLATRD